MYDAIVKNTPPSTALAVAGAIGLALNLGLAESAWADGVCSDPSISTLSAYALGTNNTIQLIRPSSPISPSQQVTGVDGNLIGIDFRPSDAQDTLVYGVTDNGKIYLINLSVTPFRATLVSTLSPQFAGGYQSLADFNPTGATNALRIIGSNDQNFAAVGANLNQTVVQTALKYAAGDPNVNVDPNITAGAYDNNVAGAPQTTFYMIDYDLDTFVTINDRNAGGSSNTGGGQLKTLGPLVDLQGKPINFAPAAGLDIYTSPAGADVGFAVSGQDLYCIDLAQVDPDQPLGTQRKVAAQRLPSFSLEIARSFRSGGLIDVAFVPFIATPPAGQADLAVAGSDSPDPVRLGDDFTYTLTVKNGGPAPATQVILASTALPFAENTGINPIPSQGNCSTDSGFRLNCKLGTLFNGGTATVTVRVGTVQSGTVATTFTVSSAVNDPNTANNSASVVTTVVP